MNDQRKAVLERVARGELSPAEGAALLEEIDAEAAHSSENEDPRDWARDWEADWADRRSDQGVAMPPPSPTGERAARVRIVRTIGTADIVGDPTVNEAVAEGPHVARRDGDTLVIEGEEDPWGMPGFHFAWGGGRRRYRGRQRRGFPFGDLMPLRVRVNPDIPLEVESQAGKLTIRGVHAPIKADVQAGSTDIVDFRSPIDLSVQAGSVRARGRLDRGASRIRCEAGGVRIRLERGSSVRVSARTTLGKVQFDNDASEPWVIGSGEGTLDISSTMGSVRVMAD